MQNIRSAPYAFFVQSVLPTAVPPTEITTGYKKTGLSPFFIPCALDICRQLSFDAQRDV